MKGRILPGVYAYPSPLLLVKTVSEFIVQINFIAQVDHLNGTIHTAPPIFIKGLRSTLHSDG
ncbi:hypothetical protein [Halobacillus seohaensis]|uniref:hypothetical protein n=1 Tax=Halobacillus seohaensis TaxID=447421 RepID=UPI0036F33B7A